MLSSVIRRHTLQSSTRFPISILPLCSESVRLFSKNPKFFDPFENVTPLPKPGDPEIKLPLVKGNPIPIEDVEALDPELAGWAKKQGPLWRLLGPDADGTLEKYRDIEGADERGYKGPLPIKGDQQLREVHSVDEMGKVLSDHAQPDQLVVIMWYEKDCKRCKKFEKEYQRLSEDQANKEVVFVKLDRKEAQKEYNHRKRHEPDAETFLTFLDPDVMHVPKEVEECKLLPMIDFVKTCHYLKTIEGEKVTTDKMKQLLKKYRGRDISEPEFPKDHPIVNMDYAGAIPNETLEDIDPYHMTFPTDEEWHQSAAVLRSEGFRGKLPTVEEWEKFKKEHAEDIEKQEKSFQEFKQEIEREKDHPLQYERIMKDHMPNPEKDMEGQSALRAKS